MRTRLLIWLVVLAALVVVLPAAAQQPSPLRGPANGSVWPSNATVELEYHGPWFCADCDGNVEFRVAYDSGLSNLIWRASGTCRPSPTPSCPFYTIVGPLPPGTYYWAYFVTFANGEQHQSDVWSFTVKPALGFTNPSSYPDVTGDSAGAADIQRVAVTTDSETGTIKIAAFIPGLVRLDLDQTVVLFLDTDQNGLTGNRDYRGAEYQLALTGDSVGLHRPRLWHWDGSQWVNLATATIAATYTDGVVFYVRRAALGNPAGFNFWLESFKRASGGLTWDLVPDASHWNYQLPVVAPRLSVALRGRPAAPRAGATFAVEVPYVTIAATQFEPDSVACRASLAGNVLRGTGAGGCVFHVPAGTAGKRLAVRVTVMFSKRTTTTSRTFVVRGPAP